MPQTTVVTVFYSIVSGIALMAIPLITCILALLILRRVDTLTAALVEIGKAVDGKLERLMAAREGRLQEREAASYAESKSPLRPLPPDSRSTNQG